MTDTEAVQTDEPVPTESQLAIALAKVQEAVPIIPKANTATVQPKDQGKQPYRYTYADLADVTKQILPLLGKNGLSFSCLPTLVGGEFVLHYALLHTSGESREGLYPLPDPRQSRPQDEGSAITYARRYCLCAATGVVSEDDDDDAAKAQAAGPAATGVPKDSKPPMAKGDWGARILDVNDTVALRDVYNEAGEAGELGLRFSAAQFKFVQEAAKHHKVPAPPRDITVGQVINVVGGALTKAEKEPKPAEGEGAWPTAEVPE